MDKIKHTPGPWRVGMESGHNPNTVFAGDEGIASIYGIPLHTHINALTQEWHKQPLANANLIAAAPELLLMLKMAQLWLDVDGRFDMRGINAAIAKAEGK